MDFIIFAAVRSNARKVLMAHLITDSGIEPR
jgi:hypothetical protein